MNTCKLNLVPLLINKKIFVHFSHNFFVMNTEKIACRAVSWITKIWTHSAPFKLDTKYMEISLFVANLELFPSLFILFKISTVQRGPTTAPGNLVGLHCSISRKKCSFSQVMAVCFRSYSKKYIFWEIVQYRLNGLAGGGVIGPFVP